MRKFIDKKAILWDFDGVILDSMDIREEGFKKVLAEYPSSEVETLLVYHRRNGGLSRYVKFNFFFKKIRRESVSEETVQRLSGQFSEIMRETLTSKERLIKEVISFIKKNRFNFDMYIVSGSDEEELNYLCRQLEISHFFTSIKGSPTPKNQLVKNLLRDKELEKEEVCLIGDSINDFEAATSNGIKFYGYNNPELRAKGLNYIKTFNEIS